jgi:hypothetical protein
MNELDFPAAHSMDTMWFAVDAQGHIGSFNTGEAGALPDSMMNRDDAWTIRQRLLDDLPRTNIIHDQRGHYLPDGRTWRGDEIPTGMSALIFVSTLEPFQTQIESNRFDVAPAVNGQTLLWQNVTPEESELLTRSGAVLGWDYYFGSDEADEYLATRGLFEFTHLTENWISGPYGRLRLPDRPIHIDQLQPRLRGILKELQFKDLSFAESAYLNPAKYFKCESYEFARGWQDVDGSVHPFIGHEKDFIPPGEEEK